VLAEAGENYHAMVCCHHERRLQSAGAFARQDGDHDRDVDVAKRLAIPDLLALLSHLSRTTIGCCMFRATVILAAFVAFAEPTHRCSKRAGVSTVDFLFADVLIEARIASYRLDLNKRSRR
jgi:hypothetical protein